MRPTPHPPLTRSPFPSEGEGLELQTRQFLPYFKGKAENFGTPCRMLDQSKPG